MCAHNLSTEDLWGSLASNYKVLNKRLCLKREKKRWEWRDALAVKKA